MSGSNSPDSSSPDSASDDRRQALLRWAPIFVALLLTFTIIAGIISVIWADRQRAIDTARGRVTVYTRLLASHAEQALTSASNLAMEIAGDSQQDIILTKDDLRRHFKTENFRKGLTKRRQDWNEVFDVGLVDSDGLLFISSDLPLDREIDLASRDYFAECMSGANGKSFIGAPALNKLNGHWHFTICQPIRGVSGHFVGAVLVAINSDYFARYYEVGGSVGHRATVLMRMDGAILAGKLPGTQYGDRIQIGALQNRIAEVRSGLWTNEPLLETGQRETRLIAAQKVPGFPVVVGTVVPAGTVLADWRSTALTLGALTATLCAALIALAVWGSRAYDLQGRLLQARLRERAAAEEAQRTKLQFVSLVSHDLRTPLTALIASADMIDGDTPLADRKNYVDLIRTAAKYVLSLVDSILNFVSSDQKLDPRKAVSFSVRQVVEDCVLLARNGALDRPLAFKTEISPDLPDLVLGNPGILAQILANILGNSVKYTCNGEIFIGASVLHQDAEGCRLRFVLRDTGPGIAAEMLRQLFQPFVRGDTHEVRATEGHGLGLAIVARLVEASQGSIAVDSGRGLGTTFIIDLPFGHAAREMEPSALAPETEQPLGRKFRILLAEDAAAVRLLLKGLIEKLGHDAVAVSDGAQAVTAAKADSFDLIIMDLRMPELDGAEATRIIRRLPEYAQTPIIALTGYSELLATELFSVAGFTAHVQKPVRIDELAALIQKVARPDEAVT